MSPSSRSRLYPFLHSTTGTAPSLSNLGIGSISSFVTSVANNRSQALLNPVYVFWQPHVIPDPARHLFGWCGRWFLFSYEVLLDGWPVKVHATLFTHVMTSEISSISCSRFENEARVQTRWCTRGGIAWVRRRRHG